MKTAEVTETIWKEPHLSHSLCFRLSSPPILLLTSAYFAPHISFSPSCLMSKPSTKPKPVAKVRKPAPQTRTMVTRAGNAHTNPRDLEVVTTDEDTPPKTKVKRKKKTRQTQEEIDAHLEKRSKVLASISTLEEEMAHEAIVNNTTPRAPSAVNRKHSYVVPVPAFVLTKRAARPAVVDSTTEDDTEQDIRPAKKARPIRDELNDIKAQRAEKEAQKAKVWLIMMSNIATAQPPHIFFAGRLHQRCFTH